MISESVSGGFLFREKVVEEPSAIALSGVPFIVLESPYGVTTMSLDSGTRIFIPCLPGTEIRWTEMKRE